MSERDPYEPMPPPTYADVMHAVQILLNAGFTEEGLSVCIYLFRLKSAERADV